ncbi:hypothetical protein JZ751_022473, partial [Albula glossodonta]
MYLARCCVWGLAGVAQQGACGVARVVEWGCGGGEGWNAELVAGRRLSHCFSSLFGVLRVPSWHWIVADLDALEEEEETEGSLFPVVLWGGGGGGGGAWMGDCDGQRNQEKACNSAVPRQGRLLSPTLAQQRGKVRALHFGKQLGGRRGCECITLEPSEMIVVSASLTWGGVEQRGQTPAL